MSGVAEWTPRLVIGLIAAGAALVVSAERRDPTPFAIEVDMASPAAGTLQVFYDRGAGINEADSVTTPIQPASAPVTYRLPLPEASYRTFRIDPNDKPGQYVLSGVRLVSESGADLFDIPIGELRSAAQASVAPAGGRLDVQVPVGANDPQLIYLPAAAIELTDRSGRFVRMAMAALAALVALAAMLLLDRAVPRPDLSAAAGAIAARPHRTVVAAALVSTLVATYPLFIGRSLVSPNNGGTAFIYDRPPFAYGSADMTVENARGTDVGSMMWAILPYVAPEREAVAHGEFPLWNRYNAIGRPLWGQAQTFFLEPVHLLALSLGEPAYEADIAFVAGRAIFAVGAGFASLAATSSLPAAALIATAAPFIGHFAFRFNHPAYYSIVYVPWILWAYFLLATRSSQRAVARAATAIVAASVLQLVGSTPKEGTIAFAIAHLTGFLAVLFASGSPGERMRRVVASVIAAALTVFIAAPHWLIFLDTLKRAYTAYDVPTAIVGGWHELAALALGPWLPGMPYPSVNGLLAVLALAALFAPSVLRQLPAAAAALIGAAAAIAVACGVIPATTIASLPLLGNLHHVWNVFLTASLTPLLVVAAAGFVAVARASAHRIFTGVIAVFVLALIVIAGVSEPPTTLAAIMAASLGPGLAFVALQASWTPRAKATATAAVAGVLLVALLPGGLHVETGSRALDAVLFQPRVRVDLDEPSPAIRAVLARGGSDPYRVASIGDAFFPGIQAYFHLEGITGPDALELRELRELTDAAGIRRNEWGWRTVLAPNDLRRASGYLDMLGVRFVFGKQGELPAGLSHLSLAAPDALEVIERTAPWPRAYFVDGVRRHPNVIALIEAAQAGPAPFASVDVNDAAAVNAVSGFPLQETVRVAARGYELTTNRTSFVIDAPGAGLVVVGEAYVPEDFTVTLNGAATGYLRVNHAFKGIVIPRAGTWHVTCEYRPARWRLAWSISAIGAVLAVALFMSHRLRRFPSTA